VLNKRLWIGLFAIVMVASLSTPGLAEDEKPDPRLAQKITYDSGSKRLHVVVEEIGRLAGMDIRCGNNNKDWQVRDIPIIVCVKDMPLGKLLRAIADATHTWFASEKIGDDPQKTYRIYRRHTESARIGSYYEEKRRHLLAVASWQWDALVACGRSERNPGVSECDWLLGKLLAQQRPGTRENVLAGDRLAVGALEVGGGKALSELQQALWRDKFRDDESGGPVVAQDLSNLMLQLELREDVIRDMADIQCVVSRFTDSPPYGSQGTAIAVRAPRELENKGLGLPPYPEDVKVPDPQADMANPAMAWLDPATSSVWDRPILSAKIDVERPTDVVQPLFADAIRAIASASRLNMVVEDFASHMPPRQQTLGGMFSKGTSVVECLRSKLSYAGCLGGWKPFVGYNTWFLNENANLLVGWADDGADNRWRDHHRSLLPEEYVNYLKSKLGAEGLDVDDAAHLITLNPRSLDEWVYTCYNAPWVRAVIDVGGQSVLWQLYDSLDPADKLAARSEAGLPLAKLNPTLIESIPWQKLSLYTQGAYCENYLKLEQDVSVAMHDPKVISSMVMRLSKDPAKRHYYYTANGDGYTRNDEPPPLALGLHRYQILVNCRIDGANHEFIAGNTPILPIWSPAREAEILAAAAAKEKDSQ
jgi:hypothetical protein